MSMNAPARKVSLPTPECGRWRCWTLTSWMPALHCRYIAVSTCPATKIIRHDCVDTLVRVQGPQRDIAGREANSSEQTSPDEVAQPFHDVGDRFSVEHVIWDGRDLPDLLEQLLPRHGTAMDE